VSKAPRPTIATPKPAKPSAPPAPRRPITYRPTNDRQPSNEFHGPSLESTLHDVLPQVSFLSTTLTGHRSRPRSPSCEVKCYRLCSGTLMVLAANRTSPGTAFDASSCGWIIIRVLICRREPAVPT
jgi:hypothetical protein